MRKRRKEEENGEERGSREEERCREKYPSRPANPHGFYRPAYPIPARILSLLDG
jgi:hypothetical protein